MSVVSYAQNFEDVMLWRALRNVEAGYYIDLGAQDPNHDSVSRLFYDNGWRGLHVEPTDFYSARLRESRPDEVVLQVAVTDTPGEMQFFDIVDTGLSTLSAEIAEDHRASGFGVREVRVPGVTLASVFELAGAREVHWLKIDVEGAEAAAIRSWSGSSVRPWILVIESTRPLSVESTHEAWDADVLALGYVFVYFDGLNRFYVSDQHPELVDRFSAPPNVFDGFVFAPESDYCVAARRKYETEGAVALDVLQAAKDAELAEVRAQGVALEAEMQARISALIEQSALEAAAVSDAHAAEVKALRAEQAQLVEMLQSDVAEAQANTEAHRVEAIRQAGRAQSALAAMAEVDARLQEARTRLAEIEASTSWRVTYPARRAVTILRRVRTSPRAAMRDAVVAAMRPVLRSPTAGWAINSVVKLVPSLHSRLRALAVSRGMIIEEAIPEPVFEPFVLGQARSFGDARDDRGTSRLSVRGRDVLKRLDESMKGEGN